MKTANCIIENMGGGRLGGGYRDLPRGHRNWECHSQNRISSLGTLERQPPSGLPFGGKDGDLVVGWAALSPVSSRNAYSGVAEVSVYVAKKFRGQGAGQLLLNHLVSASESAGVWTLQSSIFVENEASIAIHAACGFRSVGTRERIGCLYGQWRDTLLMERRSNVIGA